MAARRLVMVLLVLLIVSTFAATLVPPPPEDSADESSTTATAASASADRGRLVRATVSADARRVERIRLGRRDELELRVTSKGFKEVEIPRLGEWDEVDRFAPAVFDLIPDERGTYPVRLVEGGRPIARIVSGCCRTSRRSAGTSRSR